MTGQEIITDFELQVSDLTELSSVQELALLNKVYGKLLGGKPYEVTKRQASGSLSTSVPYIDLEDDFLSLVANHNYTGPGEFANRPVIFVGDGYQPYKVVSWDDRRQYRNDTNAAYVDIRASRIYFTIQPASALSYEYDYHAIPDALTLATSPIFPAYLQPILVHLMATEDFVLQLSDKAKSYAPENLAMAKSYKEDLDYWNSTLVQL